MYDAYLDELLQIIDLNQFIKEEIEGKGIVVIDEMYFALYQFFYL